MDIPSVFLQKEIYCEVNRNVQQTGIKRYF